MNEREIAQFRANLPERKPLSEKERAALPRVNIPPKPINGAIPAKFLQRKYIETLEQNQKLNLCCRHVEEENHQAQWFATPTADKTESGETIPDILVITCGLCGRKHHRLFVGGGTRVITTGGQNG